MQYYYFNSCTVYAKLNKNLLIGPYCMFRYHKIISATLMKLKYILLIYFFFLAVSLSLVIMKQTSHCISKGA